MKLTVFFFGIRTVQIFRGQRYEKRCEDTAPRLSAALSWLMCRHDGGCGCTVQHFFLFTQQLVLFNPTRDMCSTPSQHLLNSLEWCGASEGFYRTDGKAERKCGSFNLGRKKTKKPKTATNSSFNRVPPPVSVAVWGIVSARQAGTSPSALGTIRAPLRSQLAEEPPPYQLMDESTGMPAPPPPPPQN